MPRKNIGHEDGEEVIEGDEEGDGVGCAFYSQRDGVDDIDEGTEGASAILQFRTPEGHIAQIKHALGAIEVAGGVEAEIANVAMADSQPCGNDENCAQQKHFNF